MQEKVRHFCKFTIDGLRSVCYNNEEYGFLSHFQKNIPEA